MQKNEKGKRKRREGKVNEGRRREFGGTRRE
jgi:hypothetical protein